MQLNWNFPGGDGVQNKKPSVGVYGYFLELHNVTGITSHGTPSLSVPDVPRISNEHCRACHFFILSAVSLSVENN